MGPKNETQKSSKESRTSKVKASQVWTAEEKAAMRQAAKERKAEGNKAEQEKAALAKIAGMPKADRVLGERIHAIVKASAPGLSPKTWYGMPAYANQDGKIVCFFKPAAQYKTRYATFGFEEAANIDEGSMWPTSFALTELTPADEAKIAALVKKAAS